MTDKTRLRWIYRTSVGGGIACGLALGLATPAPAVDDRSASLISVTLDAPDVTVTFRDGNTTDESHTLDLIPQGTGATARRNIPLSGEIPSVNRTKVVTVNAGIRPGVAYCASVVTHTKADLPFGHYPSHLRSNVKCVESAGSPNAPSDVAIGAIDGEANPPAGTNRNYWINYSNSGADAKGVSVDVQTSGSITMRRPPESGTFNGMQCAPSGTGFHCTGGNLPKGAKGQIPLLAMVKSAGPGAIHATISVEGDPNPGNNAQTLGVLAVPRT
ncbi:hypothetical protein [Streptomyces sp. NBC_00091]|uniref:hypothetical protein n=1 Tax=Streptomyces sp. NBC_00091 TaxID=2975648 RepID=UPI0022500EFA|nr:hypothetical protein [Streptomyces sp. NBC_00091]MCX5379900.1 hypothetical protein [Streptomyces sp. NBC_00091]